jgi:hypothetical protein
MRSGSPYYRIHHASDSRLITVNLIVLVALVFYGLSALGIASTARTAAALADQPAAP